MTNIGTGTTGKVLITQGNGVNATFSATPSVTSITIANAPVAGTDGTNKAYVDLISAGGRFKAAATAATTTALTATYVNGVAGVGATLTNAGALVAFSVDGVSPAITSRILVKNQGSTFQNGVYTLTTVGSGAVAWVLTRATDFDQAAEILPGDLVPITSGTVNANTTWLQTATVVTVGTDAITFTQFQSAPITTTQYDVLVGGANNTIASVGPGTAGQILQSGGNAANPVYSTSTYPATNAVNTLLYASSANAMGALATANSGVLSTNSSGVPSIDTTNFAVLSTGLQLKGNNTNTVSPVGFLGEIISSTVASPGVSTTNGAQTNVTSISVTAGNWIITGSAVFTGVTAGTYYGSAVNTTTGNIGTPGTNYNLVGCTMTSGLQPCCQSPLLNVSLSGTTTYYLVGICGFSSGTVTIYGKISAIRIG